MNGVQYRVTILTFFIAALFSQGFSLGGQERGREILHQDEKNAKKKPEKQKEPVSEEDFWNCTLELLERIRGGQVLFEKGVEGLLALEKKAKGKLVEPYLLYFRGNLYWENRRFRDAKAVFSELEVRFKDHFLNTKRLLPDGKSLIEDALEDCERQLEWEKKYALKIIEPEVDRSVIVVLETELGPIRIGLYPQVAPKHVENFIKLVKEGFYNQTKFFMAEKDVSLYAGCPNTKDDKPANDGLGGPGYELEPEIAPIDPARGKLGMMRYYGNKNNHGSQFYILVQDNFRLFGIATFFGEVLEGMDVVDKINAEKLNMRGYLIKPITIERAIVEESKMEKSPEK